MAKQASQWTVDQALGADKPIEGSISPLHYFHFLEKLKTTNRAGWTRFGIKQYVKLSLLLAAEWTLLTSGFQRGIDCRSFVAHEYDGDVASAISGRKS
jgi:hypothetical protein